MSANLPLLSSSLSTGMFIMAALPMLFKAARTREMSSYSVGNLALSNGANALYSVYIFSTPPGPTWALHMFNIAVGVVMLTSWARYGRGPAAGELSADTAERVGGPAAVFLPTRDHVPTTWAASSAATSELSRA